MRKINWGQPSPGGRRGKNLIGGKHLRDERFNRTHGSRKGHHMKFNIQNLTCVILEDLNVEFNDIILTKPVGMKSLGHRMLSPSAYTPLWDQGKKKGHRLARNIYS